MTKIVSKALVTIASTLIFAGTNHSVAAENKTTVNMAGYIQFDGYNDSSTNNSVGPRGYDLLSYRSIPLDDTAAAEKSGGTKFHARSSRISFGTKTPYSGGAVITKIEGDFFGKVDIDDLNFRGNTDDDTVSNSYEFRLRQAWVKWGNWMAGQGWSNFVDLKSYPQGLTLDSVVGRPFGRQAQIRYTNPLGGGDSFSFSFENPNTDYNVGTPPPGSNNNEADTIPDLVATYFNKTDYGHIRFSLLLRQLGVDTTISDGVGAGVDDSATGYGIAASGRFNFGKSYLKWNILGGDGVGRYMYNNQFRAAILTADGLETETAWGGNLSYQYKPSKKFRFNLSYGQHTIDNDEDLVVGSVNQKISALNINGIWTVAPKTTFGLGVTHGSREVESGAEGDITRLMINVRKNFKASW